MKKKLIFLLLLFIASHLSAQKIPDTAMVEQYCAVVSSERFLSNKVTINIDYGEERSVWKDNRLKDRAGRVIKFNTVIDALNEMGKDGWKLVNAFPVTTGSNTNANYHYVFKKEFRRKDAD